MENKPLLLGGELVYPGKTTLDDLFARGYSVCPEYFEQITEEPTIARCALFKEGQKVADLGYFDIKMKVDTSQLGGIPIDLFLLESKQAKKLSREGAVKI